MPGPTTPVSVPQMGMTSPGDSAGDGRKSKRELSQSKRAAQNRAAQVSIPRPLALSGGFVSFAV